MLVPMKKATLIFLKEDRTEMLESLQRGGQLMVIPPEDGTDESSGISERERIDREQAQAMLKLINTVKVKKPFFVDRPKIEYADFMKENAQGEEVAEEANRVSEEITNANVLISNLTVQNEQLAPWLELQAPTSSLVSDRYVTVLTGYIQDNVLEAVKASIADYPAELSTYGNAPEGIAAVLVVYKGAEEAIEAVKEAGFTEASIIQTNVAPKEQYQKNLEQIEAAKTSLTDCQDKLTRLAGERDDLELLIQQMNSKESREAVPYSGTIETMTITGWIREDRVHVLEKDVARVTDVYDLTIEDPAEDEVPPTVTQNPKFLASFETITDMFSLPKAGSIDPAPIAGPWYWIIFGLMIGDVGYGAVSILLFWLFRKIRDPRGSFRKLINVLYYSSYMSVFWGLVFGSVFGETFYWPWVMFNPLDDPMTMLIFTLIIGVLHIFCGMGMKIAEDIKAGKPWDAIFDNVSWIVLISGLGFLFVPQLATLGKWMAIVGAVVIFLTAGRAKKGIGGKIVGGVLGLYDITGYLSDVLSYSRILALALSTSVVGMVMNLLAGMVSGSFFGYIAAVLILIVGHVFNLAMSTLSAYVHDSRLEYIEFFNQFYEGGGRPFKPLAVSEEYYDVLDTDHPQGSNSVGPEHLTVEK